MNKEDLIAKFDSDIRQLYNKDKNNFHALFLEYREEAMKDFNLSQEEFFDLSDDTLQKITAENLKRYKEEHYVKGE